MNIYPQTVLVIGYTSLPEKCQERIRNWLGFSNDCLLPYSRRSEFGPTSLTQDSLEEYYNDQVRDNQFRGTLDEFIDEYGLVFDKYLIDELPKLGIDPSEFEELYINVIW